MTGLIWLANGNCFGGMGYAAANQTAATLANGQCGLTDGSSAGDWRLPTKQEWDTTVARAARACTTFGAQNPPALTNDAGTGCLAAGPTSFIGVRLDSKDPFVGLHYWSSSTYDGSPISSSTIAWGETINGGVTNNFFKTGGATILVWPVRGGTW